MSQLKGGRPLISTYRKGGRVSVHDLVGPLWCEYKQYYDLVGLKKRGMLKRPLEFEVKRKVVIKEKVIKEELKPEKATSKEVGLQTEPESAALPRQASTANDNKTPVVTQVVETGKIVEKTIKILVDEQAVRIAERNSIRGQRIHEKLKDEVEPEKPLVKLRPKTLEERDANMLLEMIFGLLNLRERGVWREFPVIGSIRGLAVKGTIDEIRLETSLENKGKNVLLLSEVKTLANSAQADKTVMRPHKIQLMLYKYLLDGLLSPTVNWAHLFKERKSSPERYFRGDFRRQLGNFAKLHKLGGPRKFSWKLETMGHSCSNTASSLKLVQPQSNSELSIIYRTPETVKKGKKARREATSERHRPLVDPGGSLVTDRQSFMYDERYLQQGLDDALKFWRGGQPERGVSTEELWKCRSCEYKSSCEWREKKGWMDPTAVSVQSE